jgi:hypothetical protein
VKLTLRKSWNSPALEEPLPRRCHTVYSDRSLLTFRRNLLPPSSG